MNHTEILNKFGISTSELNKAALERKGSGVTLLLDGDGLAYKVASCYKRMETCYNNFRLGVFEMMELSGAEFARVHLTPEGCSKNDRHLLIGAKQYQHNRGNSVKPPLLAELRATLPELYSQDETITVIGNYSVEADDALMIDCYSMQNTVLISPDKDLKIAPTARYDENQGRILRISDRFGWLGERFTESGKMKIDGHGTAFFWAQMLMGDTADGVKGILKYNNKLCGEKTTYEILKGIRVEDDAANLVIDGYRAINQNPLPEAGMLWLLRTPEDTAEGYICSLGLTPENRDFILDCYNRKWKMTHAEYLQGYKG